MSAKKAADRSAAAAPQPNGKEDAEYIQEAYGEALKNQVKVLIDNYIANAPDPEGKFSTGLKIIRRARDEALRLTSE